MTYERDPLSVHYDLIAWDVMVRAIRAGRRGAAVRVWITSPRAEYRNLDAGGLTRHERAFSRACYRWLGPMYAPRDYSLKKIAVVAGPVTSRGGVAARQLRLRVFPRSAAREPRRGQSWRDDPSLRSGGIGSTYREQWEESG